MPTEQHLWKPDEDDCTPENLEQNLICGECGKAFQKPILATVSVSGRTQTYYACPRCIAKVSNVKASAGNKGEKESLSTVEVRKLTAEPENAVECGHFFGYLQKHQKNMPFPDDCLTCPRMVECILLH